MAYFRFFLGSKKNEKSWSSHSLWIFIFGQITSFFEHSNYKFVAIYQTKWLIAQNSRFSSVIQPQINSDQFIKSTHQNHTRFTPEYHTMSLSLQDALGATNIVMSPQVAQRFSQHIFTLVLATNSAIMFGGSEADVKRGFTEKIKNRIF